jgi:hypothetical protein
MGTIIPLGAVPCIWFFLASTKSGSSMELFPSQQLLLHTFFNGHAAREEYGALMAPQRILPIA